MQKILVGLSNLFFCIGYIFGCNFLYTFPFMLRWCSDSKAVKITWQIAGFAYSTFLLALAINDLLFMVQTISSWAIPWSQILLNAGGWATELVAELARRVIFLTHASRILALHRDMPTMKLPDYGKGGGVESWIILIAIVLLMLAIIANKVAFMHWLAFNSGTIFYDLLQNSCRMASRLFVAGVMILNGHRLSTSYRSSMGTFIQTLESPALRRKLDDPIHLVKQIAAFERLQEWHALYGRAIGALSIITFVENGVLGFYTCYNTFQQLSNDDQRTPDVVETIRIWLEYFLFPIFMAHIGQTIKDTIDEIRYEYKSCLLKLDFVSEDGVGVPSGTWAMQAAYNEQPLPLLSQTKTGRFIQHVVDWNWQLRACDVLNIGYSVFPVIFLNMLTIVMFIFGLRMSENSAAAVPPPTAVCTTDEPA